VIARLGTVPVFGQLDITAEATAYGGVLALRALVVIACFALHSAAVDPDDLLRAFRRISFRSALTAALATRLVPVLARDARRLDDAQRCLAGERAPRRAIVRAVAAGALDRAVDVATTLEVRGYGTARRPPRGGGRPWSRHDLAFAASAAGLVAVGIGAHVAGTEAFASYPTFVAPAGPAQIALCAVLAVCALLPFADRRGIAP
jgi:energy-coupling factor transport system permease protein